MTAAAGLCSRLRTHQTERPRAPNAEPARKGSKDSRAPEEPGVCDGCPQTACLDWACRVAGASQHLGLRLEVSALLQTYRGQMHVQMRAACCALSGDVGCCLHTLRPHSCCREYVSLHHAAGLHYIACLRLGAAHNKGSITSL